ncbi:hypothetical protein FOL47_006673 [Perkinsus chesapeaki]|uniref:Uncharacterized protein n=1 Tax=Perkinsus chesapeaki TaxID=330153 RepID=A0A7J6LQ74_PERCH|nr:hypothetical protein FOL47_006673 [Perkinsus chesapeaki]
MAIASSSSQSRSATTPKHLPGGCFINAVEAVRRKEDTGVQPKARVRRSLSCGDLFRDMFCLRREFKTPVRGEPGQLGDDLSPWLDARLMRLWRDMRAELGKWEDINERECREYCRYEDIVMEDHWSPNRWFASRELEELSDSAKETVLNSIISRIRSLQSASTSVGVGEPVVNVDLGGKRYVKLKYNGSCTEEELEEYLQERLNKFQMRCTSALVYGASVGSLGNIVVDCIKEVLQILSEDDVQAMSSRPRPQPRRRSITVQKASCEEQASETGREDELVQAEEDKSCDVSPSQQEEAGQVVVPLLEPKEAAINADKVGLDVSSASAWWASDEGPSSSSTRLTDSPEDGDQFFIGTPHDGRSDISWVETSSESSISPGAIRKPRPITNVSRPRTPSPVNARGWLSSWLKRGNDREEPKRVS